MPKLVFVLKTGIILTEGGNYLDGFEEQANKLAPDAIRRHKLLEQYFASIVIKVLI